MRDLVTEFASHLSVADDLSESDHENMRNWAIAIARLGPIVDLAVVVMEAAEGLHATPAQHTAHGLLDRMICWLKTVQTLNRPQAYQAVLAAARSLIETCADLGFLTHDKTLNEQIEAWEQWQKLRFARNLIRHVKSKGPLRFRIDEHRGFVQREADAIEALKERYWPDKKRIDRWTARPLSEDVVKVDELFPALNLERIYWEIYTMSCWGVHGSGLISIRESTGRVGGVIAEMGLALLACGEISLACIEFAASILGSLTPERTLAIAHARRHWERGTPIPT